MGGNPLRFTDPLGLWGVGFNIGGSAELGQPLAGAGLTGSIGSGIYTGQNFSAPSVGSFVSGGAFATGLNHSYSIPANQSPNGVFGGYAGAGLGLFVTNADKPDQNSGCSETYSINAGVGLIKGTVQYSIGKNGIWSLNVAPDVAGFTGAGIGASISKYPTYTDSKAWNLNSNPK